MGQLQGKTAVVLGAASEGNMGQTIARLFAKEGAKVMVAGRKEAPLAALAKEIGGEYALCDIADRAQVNAMADKAAATFGRVDIAINTTGWGLLASLEEITEEQLDQIVDLQFKGVHHFLQAFVRVMSAQAPTGGSLISLSSATTNPWTRPAATSPWPVFGSGMRSRASRTVWRSITADSGLPRRAGAF